MDKQVFTMIDEGFICEVCGKNVEPLKYSARDHCPFCLSSKHVDINPGDRQETCQGTLIPTDIEKSKKGDYKIIYRCSKCHTIRKNIMAKDDDYELIIKLSNKV